VTTEISGRFPRYTEFDPLVPVRCVTPGTGRVIHRFFDTSPFSPSGRYLALLRLPYEDRVPAPGDPADVILVDLLSGEERRLTDTRAWEAQVGAHVQWGRNDSELYFNDVRPGEWRPFGVRLDPASGRRRELEGTVYMVSPTGEVAASPCLRRTGRTQPGYGVAVPPEHQPANRGAPDDDGVYVTDLESGECRLLVSLRRIVEEALDPAERRICAGGDFYAFHVKWNPQGNRLMLVLRWMPPEGGARVSSLVTIRADGSDVRLAVPSSEWSGKGGHHPNWCPDGEHVLINLSIAGENTPLRFVRAHFDGAGYGPMNEALPGSGHPTLHPDGRHVLTDAYAAGPLAFGDGTTPIRWADIETGSERQLVRIPTEPPTGPSGPLRVDPHPAWDYSYRRFAFNACPHGTRRVFVAEMGGLLGGT
jgi:hypothetical protein